MKKHPISRRQPKTELGFLPSVLAGALCSLLLGMLLLTLLSILALLLEDPLRYAPVLALSCLFIATAAGAHLAARLHGKSGLACGLLSSLGMIVCTVALDFALALQIRTSLFLICAPALLAVAAVAGLKGVSRRESKPKRRKSHHSYR